MGFHSGTSRSGNASSIPSAAADTATGSGVNQRSKLSTVILRGSQFYERTLQKKLLRLNKDEKIGSRAIAYQQRQLVHRHYVNMSRSQKLVDMYDLPPLKTQVKTSISGNVKHRLSPTTVANLSSTTKTAVNDGSSVSENLNLTYKTPLTKRKGKTSDHLLPQRHHNDSAEDLRQLMYSPVPQKNSEEVQMSRRLNTPRVGEPTVKETRFPEITVETCEEFLPPIHRRNMTTVPEYVTSTFSNNRSSSSHSLSVPSPVLRHKSRDGKMVISTNLDKLLSRSEGSIPDTFRQLGEPEIDAGDVAQDRVKAICDPRFKTLEASLKPLQPPRPVSVGEMYASDNNSITRVSRRERSLSPICRKTLSNT